MSSACHRKRSQVAGHGLEHIRNTGVGLGIPQRRLRDKEAPRVGADAWLGFCSTGPGSYGKRDENGVCLLEPPNKERHRLSPLHKCRFQQPEQLTPHHLCTP